RGGGVWVRRARGRPPPPGPARGGARAPGRGRAPGRAGGPAPPHPPAPAAPHAYLAHVLSESGDRATRWTLRREAYRTLAQARAAIARAGAELPALARHSAGTDEVAAVLERLVDTTTACAVHLDDSGRLTPRHTERLAALRNELDERRGRVGGRRTLT
ncbi:FUSC family protein, partial [Streptomyces olivaceus]